MDELADLPAVVDAAGLLELLSVYQFLAEKTGESNAAAVLAGHYFGATRGAVVKKCKMCNRPFTVYPGRKNDGMTVRREFCSESCKMREYRGRKAGSA